MNYRFYESNASLFEHAPQDALMIFVCASFSQIWFDTSSHYTSGMCTGESLNFTERVLGYIEADLSSCNEMLVPVLLVGESSMRSTQ